MIAFFKRLHNMFKPDPKLQEHRYLCDAVDLVDLEYRMREIDRGTAWFQHKYGL